MDEANRNRFYLEGTCTCGTPYKVYVERVVEAMKAAVKTGGGTTPLATRTEVFFCPGCAKDKTIVYTSADIHTEAVPGEPGTE